MATLSVRRIAQDCLGLSGDISINTDVYGYPYRDTDGSLFGTLHQDDTFPGSGEPTTRSLKRHLQTISGPSTDLVLIPVGDAPNFSGAVSRDDVTKIQYAVQVVRDLYAQVDFGVRTLTWAWISEAEAGGYVNILDSCEAEDLTDDWNGPGGGIDVFFVQSIGDAGGWSTTPGPCDKDAKGKTGAIISLSKRRRFLGILLGHEVGHYLGLEHTNSEANMMGVENEDGIGEIDNFSTAISLSEGVVMRGHCSVRWQC